MNWNEANTHATALWKEWVSARPAVGINGYVRESRESADYQFYDLDVIHRSILQEYRWTLKNPTRMTAACLSHIKGQLILLGKVRKVLRREFCDYVG